MKKDELIARLGRLLQRSEDIKAQLRPITKLEAAVEARMIPSFQPAMDINGIPLTPVNIDKRVEELAEELVHSGIDNPILIGVMDGSFSFMSKLSNVLKHKYPDFRWEPATTSVVSMEGEKTTGKRSILSDPKPLLGARNLLIVEDLIETGGTLQDLADHYIDDLGADSVHVMVLINKEQARVNFSLELKFVGFVLPIKFVLGESMDRDGLFRNVLGVWIKGSGDPTVEEQALLDLKIPLNGELRACLASVKGMRRQLERIESERAASPGTSRDAMFAVNVVVPPVVAIKINDEEFSVDGEMRVATL